MENWVTNPYVIETSESEADDDKGNNKDDVVNFDDEEEELDVDMGEA